MIFFDKYKHLSLEASVAYAEAMHLDRVDELPEVFHQHRAECVLCTQNIMEAFFQIDVDQIPLPHPFLDGYLQESKYHISGDSHTLDEMLENIIREIILEFNPPNSRWEKEINMAAKSNGASLQINHPQNDEFFIKEILFEVSKVLSVNIPFIIRNHKGKPVLKEELKAGESTFKVNVLQEEWKSGLYYVVFLLNGLRKVVRFFVYRPDDLDKIKGIYPPVEE